MKITRRQLRRLILNEIRLNEKGLDLFDAPGLKGTDTRALKALENALRDAEDASDMNPEGNLNDGDYEDLKEKFAEVIDSAKRSGNTDITKKGSEAYDSFYGLAKRILAYDPRELDKTAIRMAAEEMLEES